MALNGHKSSRNGYRLNVKKQLDRLTEIEQNIATQPPQRAEISSILHKLNTYLGQLKQIHGDIMLLLTVQNEIDEEVATHIECEESILDAQSKIHGYLADMLAVQQQAQAAQQHAALQQAQLAQQQHVHQQQGGQAATPDPTAALLAAGAYQQDLRVNLPKLQLQKFEGDPLEWQPFWDKFESTIHNSSLPEIDKLQYLMGALKGAAAKKVSGYRLLAANYNEIVDELKQNYGNEEVAIFLHLEKFINLPPCNNETSSLQQTFDQSESHIRSLVAQGLDESTFGTVFVVVLLSKLPRSLVVDLHKRKDTGTWKLANLRDLLREELQARLMGDLHFGGKGKGGPPSGASSGGPRGHPGNGSGGPRDHPGTSRWSSGRGPPNHGKGPSAGTFAQQRKQGAGASKLKCLFCGGEHYSNKCTQVTSIDQRKGIIAKNGRCFRCLGESHNASSCNKSIKCHYCESTSHNSALCFRQFGSPSGSGRGGAGMMLATGQDSNQDSTNGGPETSLVSNSDSSLVYMQMATIVFILENGEEVIARAYLDPGSTCSYTLTWLAKKLKLQSYGRSSISNARFGDATRRSQSFESAILQVPTRDGDSVPVDVFITDTIAPPLQKLPLDPKRYPILNKVPLADRLCSKSQFASIDLLIGGDSYFDFVGSEQIRLDGGLLLLGSKLGYITAGRVRPPGVKTQNQVATMLNFSVAGKRTYNEGMDRFWEIEHIGITDDCYSKDDDLAVAHFEITVQRVDGRYEVGWPWKAKDPPLPTNYPIALKRLRHLNKRLQKEPQVREQYSELLRTQAEQGIIERVPPSAQSSVVHYLPHHCVIRQESSTTKLRVVYDASCKANSESPSLNDCMFRGPILLSDLVGILIRFRLYPIVLICDIEKAFLQLSLKPTDRDAVRFLWLKNPNGAVSNDNLIEYRFARVPFGVVASPFLLAATIKHHLATQDTTAADQINSNIYVDNVVLGCVSESEALSLYGEAKRLFGEIGMNVREWASNSTGFLKKIPEFDRADCAHPTKVLGTLWDTGSDTLLYKDLHLTDASVTTKRQLTEWSSKTFDPCGLLAPVTVRLKLLVQKLWQLKLGWDEKLPDSIRSEWACLADDLKTVSDLSIPRFIGSLEPGAWEMHTFCDASGYAYSAVIYLRAPNGNTSLVFSKTRVAPLKPMTIPRLELMGVTVGARMTAFVMQHLPSTILDSLSEPVLWCDSKCVLYWLESAKVLPVFVENRVRAIRKFGFLCRYVPTDQNPADLPTRGLEVAELKSSDLWWSGPRFITEGQSAWPPTNLKLAPPQEPKDPAVALIQQKESSELSVGVAGIDAKRFSRLPKLLAVTAYVMRFVKILKARLANAVKQKTSNQIPPLSADEIQDARLAWTFHSQQHFFGCHPAQETRNLKKQLDLFEDASGFLRCGGRFRNAQGLTENSKFPLFLPKRYAFTKLVMAQSHIHGGHMGESRTLAEFRGTYWTPCGQSQAQSAVRSCQLCRVWEGGPFKVPDAAPLPAFRATRSEPFEYTGVDYLGPLEVSVRTGDQNPVKVWVCLFTCCVTRAIHLEVVPDCTARQFLLSLRRFIALHRKPKMIISDNGKQFKLATNVLDRLWSEIVQAQDVQAFCGQQEIAWKFIPDHAPWFGGFYERLVQSVKRTLKKILGRLHVTLLELQTLVAETSAVVNSRPLVMSANLADPILTPAHLLGKSPGSRHQLGGTSDAQEDPDFLPQPQPADALVSDWKLKNTILQQFWDVWQSDYLLGLREAHAKRQPAQRKTQPLVPCEGMVVLVKDDKQPRCVWKVGVIESVNTSQDGAIRSATIRQPNNHVITRPIKLLYPIESDIAHDQNTVRETGGDIHRSDTHTQQNAQHTDTQNTLARNKATGGDIHHGEPSTRRPKRSSALQAKWLIENRDAETFGSD